MRELHLDRCRQVHSSQRTKQRGETLALAIIGYGFFASALPVWLLLCPRDYLSTFLKIGTITLLAIGIVVVRPDLKMPAITQFIDGTGPVWSEQLEQASDLRANHRIEPLKLGFVVCEHQQIELPPLCVLLLFHHCLRQSESFPTKAMKIRAVHQ